jgi:hypothetical protein
MLDKAYYHKSSVEKKTLVVVLNGPDAKTNFWLQTASRKVTLTLTWESF